MDVERIIGRLQSCFHEGDPGAEARTLEKSCLEALVGNYRAIGSGDFVGAVASLHGDVEMEIYGPPGTPFVGRWKGLKAVAKAMQANFAQVELQDVEIESVAAQGDSLVLLAHEVGRFRATGKQYDLRWVQWFRFREGKIVHIRELFDTAAVRAAASPSDADVDAL